MHNRFTSLVITVLLAAVCATAAGISNYALPPQRFQGWSSLQNDITDTSISQVWREQLLNMPKGASGYAMVCYQVSEAETPVQANRTATQYQGREQFNEYVARGYALSQDAWVVRETPGSLYTIRGLSHSSASTPSRAQRAEVYNLAFARDTHIIWLQVRQVCTADQLDVSDKAMRKSTIPQLAVEVASYVVDLWTPRAAADTPAPTTPVQQPAVTPPAIVTPTSPVQLPSTPQTPAATDVPIVTTPPATEAPAQPAAVTPPTGMAPAEPATVVPPTMETPLPLVVTAPPAAPVPATTETAATPAPAVDNTLPVELTKPDAVPGRPRWKTSDGFLSLLLPDGGKASNKYPYSFTGLGNVQVRLYPWESYSTDAQRENALQDFIVGQQEIAKSGFTQQACRVDGAVGVCVRYINYADRQTVCYFFGKSQRLWRLTFDITDTASTLPTQVQNMLESLRVQ